jgi:CubicO group peptidase (beta-lactamase class C family)
MSKKDGLAFDYRQKRVYPFIVFSVSTLTLFLALYCSPARADLEARIQRIENGLEPEPGIVLKGQMPQKAVLLDRMSAYKIPGVSIAVINDYKIEWARGYGVKEAGENDPVTVRTLFQAASISKPVAALATLYFVEQGLLDLDDDVNGKLRSWRVPDNEFTSSKKVTLRGMMSHNAGLTVHGFRGYGQGEEVPSLHQVLDGEKPANSKAIRVDKEPGTGFRYSGGGYTVIQQLLIDVKGKPFPEIMRETVLDKLKMIDSTYEQPLPESLANQAATAHRMNGKAIQGKWHTYPEMAAAGLWTTPADLCRFAIEVMKSRKGRSQRVLSQKMIRQMLTEQAEGIGLGLFLWDEGEDFRFMHGGSNEGFRCVLMAYPEKGQGAAIMTNSDYGGSLMSELLRSLSTEYGWKHFRPVEKDVAEIDPDTYEEYAGIYQVTPSRKIKITREGDRLFADPIFVIPSGDTQCEIFPESETVFFMTRASQKITFTRDEKGKVNGLFLEDGGRRMKAKKLRRE